MVCILIVFGMINLAFSKAQIISNNAVLEENNQQSSQYETHAPISIENNTDFGVQAQNEGWDGDGSQSNPYVIELYKITATTTGGALVEIKNTDVYFELSNNLFDGNSQEIYGIKLNKVKNGTILYNVVQNCKLAGIKLLRSENNEICGNSISNNGIYKEISLVPSWVLYGWGDLYGIYLELSHANLITNNTVEENMGGVMLSDSTHNFVSKNTVSNHLYGIGFINAAHFNVISENTINSNTHAGICSYFDRAHHNLVTKNLFYGNKYAVGLRGRNNTVSDNVFHDNSFAISFGSGVDHEPWYAPEGTITNNIIYNNSQSILLEYASETNVMNNSIFTNQNFGLEIFSTSNDNIIKWNDFIKNNPGGESQAIDDGTNNEFTSNYWWTSSAKAYSIAGEAQNTDTSPRVSPNNPNSPDITAAPDKTPSWSVVITMVVFITIIVLRKRKIN